MPGDLLLAFSVLSFSALVIFQRRLLATPSAPFLAYSILVQFAAGLLLSPALLIDKSLPLEQLRELQINLMLSVLLYATSNILAYRALQFTSASHYTILLSSRSMWTVLWAALLFSDYPTIRILLGLGLMLGAVVLIAPLSSESRASTRKGLLFCLISAAAFGTALINDSIILRLIKPSIYLPFAFLMPPILILAITPKTLQSLHGLPLNIYAQLALCGGLTALSALALFGAYRIGVPITHIAVISESSTILVALFTLRSEHGIWIKAKTLTSAILCWAGAILVRSGR
jgi:uncharacterized membrane protein